jgi:hypothetical protein
MQTNENTGALLDCTFAGPKEFAQLVRDAIACAGRDGWTEMVWSDPSFEDWPLREKLVVDLLTAWSHTGRRLVLLANGFDSVQRHQSRFVAWRKTWDHIVECRVSKGRDAEDLPSAIWSPQWAMRRMDTVHSKGVAGSDAQRRVSLKQELDECLRQSSVGFPATTLGL